MAVCKKLSDEEPGVGESTYVLRWNNLLFVVRSPLIL